MAGPRLSVLLPTYDAVEFVERAVGSVLDQTYEDFELIVIDDGSTDGTVEAIRQFEDDRIRLIQREDESGITSALNAGIDAADGEYLARQDADDWSAPERFERQVGFLDANPEVALLGTGAWLVDEDGQRTGRRRVLERPDFEDLLVHNEFVHGSVMMRREALEAVDGYDEWFPTTEDYDLWLRLAKRFPTRNIDEPLYAFRQHESSVYASGLERLKLYHVIAARRATRGLDEDIKRRVERDGPDVFYEAMTMSERRWFHRELTKELLRYGEVERARSHAKKVCGLSGVHPIPYALWALTYTTPTFSKLVAKAFRKVINTRIAFRHRC